MRVCDCCKAEMNEGYCVLDTEYFCCDDCLHSTFSPEEYKELFEADEAYWTQWEE